MLVPRKWRELFLHLSTDLLNERCIGLFTASTPSRVCLNHFGIEAESSTDKNSQRIHRAIYWHRMLARLCVAEFASMYTFGFFLVSVAIAGVVQSLST